MSRWQLLIEHVTLISRISERPPPAPWPIGWARWACFVVLLSFWLASAGDAAGAQPAAPAEVGTGDTAGAEAAPAPVTDKGSKEDSAVGTTPNPASICRLIEAAAAANGLPLEFFARIIWQESGFHSDAIGPLTRSGQRAQGIAQFMPM